MLEAKGVTVSFRRRGGAAFKALDNVSLSVPDGAIVGLVGESGSGKTTLVRTLCGLIRPDEGRVEIDGRDAAEVFADARKGRGLGVSLPVSMVFQDAVGALDPRQTASEAVAEALRVHRTVLRGYIPAETARLLAMVGLPADVAEKRSGEMSGGQCQRVCIARAMAPRPSLLIGDEPVSALDVSIQARILKLLAGLLENRENGLRAILLVTHDLAVVSTICTHVSVMEKGRIVESGIPREVFAAPRHPCTRHLLAAAHASGLHS